MIKVLDKLERQSMPIRHVMTMVIWIIRKIHQIGKIANRKILIITMAVAPDHADLMATFLHLVHTKVDL